MEGRPPSGAHQKVRGRTGSPSHNNKFSPPRGENQRGVATIAWDGDLLASPAARPCSILMNLDESQGENLRMTIWPSSFASFLTRRGECRCILQPAADSSATISFLISSHPPSSRVLHLALLFLPMPQSARGFPDLDWHRFCVLRKCRACPTAQGDTPCRHLLLYIRVGRLPTGQRS